MTRAECLLAAVTRELDRRRRAVDAEDDLVEVLFRAKFDKRRRRLQSVQMSIYTEHETEEKAA